MGKAVDAREAVESAIKGIGVWLKEMADAAGSAAKSAEGAEGAIGNVDAGAAHGAKGDAESVKGIAKGMRGIVEAAKKGGVELKADGAGAGENENAGKIFATGGNGADADAVGKAVDAVSKVSGKQILKAIVDDAENGGAGKKAEDAKNVIDAAIGGDADNGAHGFNKDEMKKNDKIAAAIVLRGMAKNGKFAAAANQGKVVKSAAEGAEAIGNVAAGDAAHGAKGDEGSVKGIAKGMKGIVEAAKKGGVELKADGAGAGDADAGKIFATTAAAGDADAVGKAVDAVSKVSGKQILKAIVDDAENGDAGATAANAKNVIDAAIGDAADNGDNGFNQNEMKKNDKIAAAIVLRGMAKNGKFAAAANQGKAVKSAAEGAEAIGNVDADAAAHGAKGDAGSVKGIAKGMKGIVEAAKKGGVELKADGAGAGAGAGAAADADAVGKAVDAVSKVSGKQILKAIVDDAENGDAGTTAEDATNVIDAAIGEDADNGARGFNQDAMKKNDKIAAAIVLRGMAKNGKFAAAADQGKAVKSAAEGAEAIRNVKLMLMLMLMLVLWGKRLMLEKRLKVR